MHNITFLCLIVPDPLANTVLSYFLKLCLSLTDKEQTKQAYTFCAPCGYLAQAAWCCNTTVPIFISRGLVTESKSMDLVLKPFRVPPRALQAPRQGAGGRGCSPRSQPAQGPATSPHPSNDSRCRQGNWEAPPRRAQDNPLLSSSSPAFGKCTSWQKTVKNTETTKIPAFKSSSLALCYHRVHPVQRHPKKIFPQRFQRCCFLLCQEKSSKGPVQPTQPQRLGQGRQKPCTSGEVGNFGKLLHSAKHSFSLW